LVASVNVFGNLIIGLVSFILGDEMIDAIIFTVVYWSFYWAAVIWSSMTNKSFDLTVDEYLLPIIVLWISVTVGILI